MNGRPDLPGLVNGPVLMLSALLASPACVLLAQGLLTVTEVLIRYLVITVGCIVLWGVLRAGLIALVTRPLPVGADDANGADDAISGVVVDARAAQVVGERPASLDPDALDMPAEDLIALSLRREEKGTAA
ncbi:hypothetical protein [Nocardioides pelophilus]|uniref:hypothetical protein n=1 Tax=Nocardioides pelophilus TaxID=2172019 RepID=UPI0016005F24|nr:hypothetical protein [Nocardioides pelophilus]